MGLVEIKITEDKTVKELIDELRLTSAILLEVNGEVFYLEGSYSRILKSGDMVTLIPIIAGG